LLGIGLGTLAAYGRSGDEYRLYEINPAVAELARGGGDYFSFLGDSRASITVVLGDPWTDDHSNLFQILK
jgi:hypothetical protein